MTNQVNEQSLIPSTDVIQLTLTLKMTTAQVVETLVTVNNNSPIEDYVHQDDHTQSTCYKVRLETNSLNWVSFNCKLGIQHRGALLAAVISPCLSFDCNPSTPW